MTNMDKFLVLLEETIKASKEIDGIESVTWNLKYDGDTSSVETLNLMLNKMFNRVNGNCKSSMSTRTAS